VPAGDGRHESDATDSIRRAPESLEADRRIVYDAPGTTRYAKYDHVFQLGHEIVSELAVGIVAPELKALAIDALRVGTETVSEVVSRQRRRELSAAEATDALSAAFSKIARRA